MHAPAQPAVVRQPLRLARLGLSREAGLSALASTVVSRTLVWCAGVGAVSLFGSVALPGGVEVPGFNSGLGRIAERLSAPFSRWDASWYALIAQHGYHAGAGNPNLRVAFFPLYPLLLGVLNSVGLPLVVAGFLVSTIALGAALYGLHLLMEIELRDRGTRARGAVLDPAVTRDAPWLAGLALALCPMAVFFSAVYSDSLYLALSVGAFLYARRGRWGVAAALGGLAAATRASGVLLVIPLVVLYLYGPREDAARVRARGSGAAGTAAERALKRLNPRFLPRPDFSWLLLVPLGLLAFMGYLGLTGSDPLAPFQVERIWGHAFTGPITGIVDGARSALHDLRRLLDGQAHLAFFSRNPLTSVYTGWENLMPFAFLLLTVPALVGVARKLPIAYLLYVLAALAMAVSEPVTARPLQSLPRYEAVLFPLFMWFGMWLARHRRLRLPLLLTSSALAALFAAEFATWHFVA